MDGVNVRQVLLDMRKYRMGLIQTYEQLRFSYMAIIEGGKALLNNDNGDVPSKTHENSSNVIQRIVCNENRDEREESEIEENETIPLPLPPRSRKSENVSPPSPPSLEATGVINNNLTTGELRLRARDERKKKTMENIKRIKEKAKQIEERSRLKKIFLKSSAVAVGIALVVGTCILFYNNYLTSDKTSVSYRPPSS